MANAQYTANFYISNLFQRSMTKFSQEVVAGGQLGTKITGSGDQPKTLLTKRTMRSSSDV